MKVIRAQVLGYCMGVRRAVEIATQALHDHASDGTNVYSLGPLIHNPGVLSELKAKGLSVLSSDTALPPTGKSVVVIRAHGTTPFLLDSLRHAGALVLDATCPRVHASQKRAASCARQGGTVIVAGDKNHGEVVSICAHAGEHAVVVQNQAEAEDICVPDNALLLSQTTFSPDDFADIIRVVRKKNPTVQVCNSICPATLERQLALRNLAGKVEGLLVIGGANSANTRRLYQIAQPLFSHLALIENERDIPEAFFALNTVGLSAGASTPDSVINAVQLTLEHGTFARFGAAPDTHHL
ncbi:MAG: 4-hydroxy-3-methylbut-2-enyl diphosphate reductase [Treponema sp.]|nr:4-hydroxy-3-methylbut-2-enyl diphosphate reductase [Treponema sp.]